MAITLTALVGSSNNANQSSYAIGSSTMTANRLQLACFHTSMGTATATLPTLSGNNRTWTQVQTQLFDSSLRRLTIFRALAGTTDTAGLTLDFGGVTQSGALWSIFELDGIDTGGTNGSAAIIQNGVGSGSGTTFSATLAAFADAVNNVAVGLFGIDNNSAIDHGSGFTEIHDFGHGSPGSQIQTQWKIGEATTVSSSQTNTRVWGAIALEIKAAAAGGASNVPRAMHGYRLRRI